MTTETRTVQERLRDYDDAYGHYNDRNLIAVVSEAADRIDELEKALKDSLSAFVCTQRVNDYPATHWSHRAVTLLSPPSDDSDAQAGGMK